jgi:hypothetical protein
LRQIETGEFQISLNESSNIERMTRQGKLLQKFRPANYDGTLRALISEINEKFSQGWEIDHDLIKSNLAASLHTTKMAEKRDQKSKRGASFREILKLNQEAAELDPQKRILRKLSREGLKLEDMGREAMTFFAANSMMSVIELQALKDKAEEKMRNIQMNEGLARQQARDALRYGQNSLERDSYHSSEDGELDAEQK